VADFIDDQFISGHTLTMPSKRTSIVVMTNEARVLKHLRERAGLSMRDAGELMGYSSSFVSQVENGRANPPQGESLAKFLKTYGIEQRAYSRMVTEFKSEVSDLEILESLLPKLSPEAVKTLKLLAEQFVGTKKAR
jgi:transcriptional regulator with XRE-family HTH domain